MNISLTPELDTYVHEKVQTGMYHSASEVIREGLRLLKEQDHLREARLEQLRGEINIGIEQIARGEYTEYEAGDLVSLSKESKAKGRVKSSQRLGK